MSQILNEISSSKNPQSQQPSVNPGLITSKVVKSRGFLHTPCFSNFKVGKPQTLSVILDMENLDIDNLDMENSWICAALNFLSNI